MAHNHLHPVTDISLTKLVVAILLNLLTVVFQVIGGIVSGSLSLISDAMHNFSDAIAIVLTYLAYKLSKGKHTEKYTFGLKRIEIIVAILNSLVLVSVSILLFKEAYSRLVAPEPIVGPAMIIVAVIGLIANLLGTMLLHEGASENINIRSAYLHLMSDAVSSVAIVIGGGIIYFFNILWIDPLLTFLIGVYVLWESWKIILEALNILIMAKPDFISIKKIQEDIEALETVKNIHHLHVWRLNDHDIHLEAHIDVHEDLTLSKICPISDQITEILFHKHQINHPTLQFEFGSCKDVSLVKGTKSDHS